MTNIEQILQIRKNHFNETKKVWMSESNPDQEASPEESKMFQRKIRLLKFTSQAESDLLSLADQNLPPKKRKTLEALISRRLHPEFWHKLNKTEPDGILFTFNPPEILKVCGCSTAQLETGIEKDYGVREGFTQEFWGKRSDTEHTAMLVARRNSHNEYLDDGDDEDGSNSIPCPSPKEEVVRQNTHTIGNIACQACLTMGESQEVTPDILAAAFGAHKVLELCPRFISPLHSLGIAEYIKVMANGNLSEHLCYAGLVHTEMTFDTYYKTADGKLYAPDAMVEPAPSAPTALLPNQEVIVITYKCDTCSYTTEKVEEYNPPAPVEDGQPLAI